mgnify:CR=1 FL=1
MAELAGSLRRGALDQRQDLFMNTARTGSLPASG